MCVAKHFHSDMVAGIFQNVLTCSVSSVSDKKDESANMYRL